MIYVLVLVTFYYIDGVHEEGSICQVREEDFDARFMKKLKSPWENIYSKTEVDELLNAKQNLLIEGTGIDIDEDDEISCTVEPSQVTVTQVQTTGTKIATIDVDGVDTDIYAPAASGGLSEDVIADEFDTTPTVVPPSGTLYQSGDKVYKDSGDRPTNNCYRCTANNTQSGTWNSSKWTQLTDVTEISSPGAQVDPGKVVIDRTTSKAYECIASWPAWFVTGSPDPSQFKQLPNYDTAPYSPGSTTYHQYSAGDFCMHEGGLYKCTASTTGQSWVASKWETTQVTDELGGGGSSGGATVIEVWDLKENTPDPTPALAESLYAVQSNHSYCNLKVNGVNKTAAEVKALLETGFCVLKTSAEIATVLACESSHGYLFVQSYGQNIPSNYAFTYTSSYKWMPQ